MRASMHDIVTPRVEVKPNLVAKLQNDAGQVVGLRIVRNTVAAIEIRTGVPARLDGEDSAAILERRRGYDGKDGKELR